MALGNKVKIARKNKGLTQAQLAEKVGISQTAIQLLESRDSQSSKFLLELSQALDVSVEWLKNDGIKEELANYPVGNAVLIPEELLEKRHSVPLLTWVSAGAWLQNHGCFKAEDAERWLPCPVAHSMKAFALKVEGDSMTSPYPNEKSYPHGTLIYVDPEKPLVNRCSVVAYLQNEQAYTFKRYVEDSGRKYLKPLNPTYDTIQITDDIQICGVVIGAFFDE